MKTLMNSFAGLAFTLMGALAVISCDPCSGVVCNNGSCSNGTCICEDGYERNNSSCVAVNKLYIGTGTVSATIIEVDVAGNSITRNNIAYTLTASDTDPYMFTLEKFNNLIKNDITFTISPSNYEIVEAGTTVTAALPHPDARLQLSPVMLVGQEKTLKGSYLGSCVPSRDIPAYIELYKSGRLDVDKLISHTLHLNDINEGFERLAAGNALRQIIIFD